MCGIVCFYGHSNGLGRVLNALDLLAYRAPDSCGLAVLSDDGTLAVRRAVGTSEALRSKIAVQPLALKRTKGLQVVVGHGRWAMVGAVTEANAHPLLDRSCSRVACENGSHNATLMLGAMTEQERWWRERGLAAPEPVHRSENTTEVLVFEWERISQLLAEGHSPPNSDSFLGELDSWGIDDPEERALRLAIWRLRGGNAHACVFYGRQQPEVLYVSSHNKPIALAMRGDDQGPRELMVASDVNAALMLWPKEEVIAAAARIDELQRVVAENGPAAKSARLEVERLTDRFTVQVIFLDRHLNQGQELFARICHNRGAGQPEPEITVTRYDGRPVTVKPQPYRLNPAMIGKQGYASYTESHIAEIPGVVSGLAQM